MINRAWHQMAIVSGDVSYPTEMVTDFRFQFFKIIILAQSFYSSSPNINAGVKCFNSCDTRAYLVKCYEELVDGKERAITTVVTVCENHIGTIISNI